MCYIIVLLAAAYTAARTGVCGDGGGIGWYE